MTGTLTTTMAVPPLANKTLDMLVQILLQLALSPARTLNVQNALITTPFESKQFVLNAAQGLW